MKLLDKLLGRRQFHTARQATAVGQSDAITNAIRLSKGGELIAVVWADAGKVGYATTTERTALNGEVFTASTMPDLSPVVYRVYPISRSGLDTVPNLVSAYQYGKRIK